MLILASGENGKSLIKTPEGLYFTVEGEDQKLYEKSEGDFATACAWVDEHTESGQENFIIWIAD